MKTTFTQMLITGVLLMLALPAQAHLTRWDTVRMIVNKGGAYTVITAAAHGTNLGGQDYAQSVESRLKLAVDGKPVAAVTTHVAYDRSQDWVLWEGRVPGNSPDIRLTAPLIAGRDTAVVEFVDGRQVRQTIVPGRITESRNTFLRVYSAGIVHILTGIDHIAFILLVLLACTGSVPFRKGAGVAPHSLSFREGAGVGMEWRRLVKTLTLFTLAHSVSLGLAACGLWAPSPRVVEPLIAASIVWQAVSVLLSKDRSVKHQSWIVLGFGLVHGFGFAGGIAQIGFNKAFILPSLLAFNLGIETGQLIVAAAVVPLLIWVTRARPSWRLPAIQSVAAGLGLMGLFLMVQRLAGLA